MKIKNINAHLKININKTKIEKCVAIISIIIDHKKLYSINTWIQSFIMSCYTKINFLGKNVFSSDLTFLE